MAYTRSIRTALFAAALAAVAPLSQAESLRGPDKVKHAALSTAIGFGATTISRSRTTGFLACAGAGIAKELVDAAGYGTPSAMDLVADAIGCAVGTYAGGLVVRYSASDKGLGVGYRATF